MNVVLIDIDNCVSNDGWRIPRIDWAKTDDDRYHDYHTLAPFDEPGNLHIIRDALRQKINLAFLTARPVTYSALTQEWLLRMTGLRRFQYDLFMRSRGDSRPSVAIKRQQLNWLLGLHDLQIKDIVGAFDDHAGIVEMYQSLGIPAQRLAIHDVCAYTNPLEKKNGTTS